MFNGDAPELSMLILFSLLSKTFLRLVAEGKWGKKMNKILNLLFYIAFGF